MPIVEESLVQETKDPFISSLKKCVIAGVKILAVLMVGIIWMTLADVVYHTYELVSTSTLSTIFNTESVFSILGDFLAVLIAIEIFLNILFFLRKDAIHLPLVLSTALTAAARKVIIVDFLKTEPYHLISLAFAILALGVAYWLVGRLNFTDSKS